MDSGLRVAAGTVHPGDMTHLTIYRDDEFVANWPFTGGMWRFADGEVAVAFTRLRADSHPKSTDHMCLDTWGEICLVRSRDDGVSWQAPEVVVDKRQTAIEFFQHGTGSRNARMLDFRAPDAILICNYVGEHLWVEDYSQVRFWTMLLGSADRGRTWALGPLIKKPRHLFSAWGTPTHVVRPDGSLLVFNDCVLKADQGAGPMYVFADILEGDETGAAHYHFHGLLQLERRDAELVIHPATVSLGDGAILLATRHQTADRIVYVMLHRSDDWGRNWRSLGRVTDVGGTPHLLRLRDGRILLTYERRQSPKGMRARLSEDEQGLRWGPEVVLRTDGFGDHGYSRNVQRADGRVLTSFYYSVQGDESGTRYNPVRYIAGTIWDPDSAR